MDCYFLLSTRKINLKVMIFLISGVAFILTNEAKVFDSAVIAAAMLHDTVEDTKTTFDEIKEHFGQEVYNKF